MNNQVLKYLPTLGMWSVAIVLLVFIERLSVHRYLWGRNMLIFAQGLRGLWSDRIFALVTWAGSLFILVPASAVSIAFLLRKGRAAEAGLLGLSLAGIALFSRLAKLWFARPRPNLFPIIGEIPLDASYPSAHTAQIVAFVVTVGWIMKPDKLGFGYFFMSWVAFLLVAAVAYSRIHLQVHFPSDVLGGALLGLLWVMGLVHLLHNIGIVK